MATENTSTITSRIVAEFSEIIDTETSYSLRTMQKILSDIYKKNTQKKNNVVVISSEDTSSDDDAPKKRGRPANKPKLAADGSVKPKRKPTAYNIYMKMKIEELKESNPNVLPKELLPMAAAIWSEMKQEEKDSYKSIAA